MKCATMFMLLAAMLVAVSALPRRDPPRLPRPTGGNPNFGSYGSFNPRGRRSLDGEATVDDSYNEKFYEGEHGTARVYGTLEQTQEEQMNAAAGDHYESQFGEGGDAAATEDARIREIEPYRE